MTSSMGTNEQKDWNSRTKLKDLPLFDVEERLRSYRRILRQELRDKGISFDFHVWVSDEWFCPDGVPGFAVPFYLFNPELMQWHRRQTGHVEGRSDREILKLMRHELGHAIDNAYGLRRDPERQRLFGSPEQEYPEHYSPRVFSKDFVHYLGDHYAQSHPDEDFAETFAYWLDPSKRWQLCPDSKKRQQKLACMSRLMRKVRGRRPVLKNRFKIDPIHKNTESLGEFYERYRTERGLHCYERVDRSLKTSFSRKTSGQPVARLLKAEKQTLAKEVAQQEQVHRYEVERAIKKIIERAERLGLMASEGEFRQKTPSLLKRNFRYLKEKDQLRFYL